MKNKKNNSISLNKYKNKQEINIGIFVFAIVFIYLIVTILAYVTTKHVSVYEVREGSILKDSSYTGIALREETTINTDAEGYINYFMAENSKIKTAANIYTISPTKLPEEAVTADAVEGAALSSSDQDALIMKTQNFNLAFDEQDFSQTIALKTEIDATLQKATNQTKTAQLDALLASEQGAQLAVYQTPTDGIFSLDVDGYEGLTIDTLTEKDFNRANYAEQSLQDNRKVSAGENAYKLVTSNDWSIVLELTKDDAKQLKDTTYIKTRIENSSETIDADFSIVKKDKKYYGILSFDNSMIQYISKRFLNVELILEDETGLKIPKTSILQKEFYPIPSDYITYGGDSSASGVLKQTSKGDKNTTEFIEADIYQQSEDMVYIDTNLFKKGDTIVMPETGDTMQLNKTEKLTGVYNLNKGYTVFQQVEILCESDDYYIVQTGAAYSLSNYDHIVLDSDTVREGEVIFQ